MSAPEWQQSLVTHMRITRVIACSALGLTIALWGFILATR